MARWIALVLIGCGSSAPQPAMPPVPPVPVIDAAVPVTGTATDPPEPAEPRAECVFARSVFCVAGAATRTELEPPFERCQPKQPARKVSVAEVEPRFSAAETRAKRADDPAACCYVEYSTLACR